MGAGREKDQKDFDLEQIVRIIDQALESDDQRIKDALRALLTVTVLCTAERPDQAIKGPLARLQEDYLNLNRRLNSLEAEVDRIKWDQQKQKVDPVTPPYAPFGPNPTTGWPGANNPIKPTPMWGPSWTSTDVGDIKTWSAGDDPSYKGSSASSFSKEDLDTLLGVK